MGDDGVSGFFDLPPLIKIDVIFFDINYSMIQKIDVNHEKG